MSEILRLDEILYDYVQNGFIPYFCSKTQSDDNLTNEWIAYIQTRPIETLIRKVLDNQVEDAMW